MNKVTAALLAIIVILVAVVAFMLGQRGIAEESAVGEQAAIGDSTAKEAPIVEADAVSKEKPAPNSARPVRIGVQGASIAACLGVGRVGGLGGSGDDFLSVREAPTSKAREIAKLGMGDVVYFCERAGVGKSWLGVAYSPDRRMRDGDRCQVEVPVSTPRNYDGPCISGWVYGKYIVDRYEPGAGSPQASAPQTNVRSSQLPAAPKRYTFNATYFLAEEVLKDSPMVFDLSNSTRAVASEHALGRGEDKIREEKGKLISNGVKAVDGIPRSYQCNRVTEDGKVGWRCSTTFTYEK